MQNGGREFLFAKREYGASWNNSKKQMQMVQSEAI